MICTLIPDFLPVQDKITPPLEPSSKTDLVTVWDIEEDAWRSFKPSRITNIEFSPE